MFTSWITSLIQNAIQTMSNKAAEAQEPQISLSQKIKQYYLEHGYTWEEVNLIGIRRTEIPYKNQFKDLLLVVEEDRVNKFPFTTLPGSTWTPELRKKYGVSYEAVICFGYYKDTWRVGNHRGYEALSQQGGPVTCYIDKNKDGIQNSDEKTYLEPVGSGMNIHKSGVTGQANVGLSSAGCQVFPIWDHFNWTMERLKSTEKFKANPKALFSYLLVNSQEFPFMQEVLGV